MFQFYDSPIKSRNLKCRGWQYKVFQFYDSPIKSRSGRAISTAPTARFQFYDSPIKSRLGYYECLLSDEFQFYDSPIKRWTMFN